ncbi:glycosyltransferase family 4 protein [Sulfurimonas sp.]|uniref:MraY family glycosyltransferase n=1 Tax=Sulfurimonas sp. TaxID=2022749 RepID=UPI002B4A71AE|nr:glycosyltransferase family 4 protein [Sulfurimonas sp.]
MIYIILFIISFVLTYFIKNYYIKNALFDEVNERSSHAVPTPHGGGIAISIAWFLGISYFYFIDAMDSSLYFALLVGLIISVVSFFDDLHELSAKVRLFTQALVSFLALYLLGGLESLDFYFFSLQNQIITNIFAFFMIVWFINLYNFLDGIDGYAGSEAIFLALAGYFIFGGNHFLVLVFVVLGFLVWNWHKAKIFMGDVSSTLLGYNVAIFSIYYANQEATNLWIWITLFGVFWFDATLTLYRRYKNREQLSQAHKKHAYQRLNQSGWAHDKVVIYSIFVNIVLFCLVCFISNIFVAFIMSLIFLYAIIKFVDKKKVF